MWTESASVQVPLPLSTIQQQHRSWLHPQRRSSRRASIPVAGNIHTREWTKKKEKPSFPFQFFCLPPSLSLSPLFSVKHGVLAFKFSSRRNSNFLVKLLQFRFFYGVSAKSEENLNLCLIMQIYFPTLITHLQKPKSFLLYASFLSNFLIWKNSYSSFGMLPTLFHWRLPLCWCFARW